MNLHFITPAQQLEMPPQQPSTGQLCLMQGCSDLPSPSSALPIPEEQGPSLLDLNLSRAGRSEMLKPMMEMTAPERHSYPLEDPSPDSSSELQAAALPGEL